MNIQIPFCPNCGYKQEQSFVFCPQCGHQRVELPKPKPPQPTIAKVILILLAWLLGAFAASFLGAGVAIFLGTYDMYGATPAFWGTLLLGLILNWKQRRMRIGFILFNLGLLIIPPVVALLASGTLIKPISAPVVATQRPYHTATPFLHPTPKYQCISWSSVNMSHIGKTVCVYGIAYDVYPTNESPTRIRFSDQPNTFYLLNQRSPNPYYYAYINPGDCVAAEGIVLQKDGQLYMIAVAGRNEHCKITPQP